LTLILRTMTFFFIVYALYVCLYPSFGVVAVWSLVETAFHLYQLLLGRLIEFNGLGAVPDPMTPTERQHLFEHCLSHAPDMANLLSSWFRGVPIQDISLDNVKDWLAWAFYSKYPYDLDEGEEVQIEWMLKTVAATPVGAKLSPVKRKHMDCMRLTLDEVHVSPRPLVFYGLIYTTQMCAHALMVWRGFRRHTQPALEYWIKQGTSNEAPLVVVHGLTTGLLPYMPVVNECVRQYPQRTIVVLRLPHLSGRLPVLLRIPSRTMVQTSIAHLFKKHSLGPAVWMAHSFGTIVATWAVHHDQTQQSPLLVERVVLVDPVCFALWEPDVVHNFVYKRTTGWLDVLIRYFVAQECSIAASINRHFWWYKNLLLGHNVPQGSHVFLSRRDGIIDAGKVGWYLAEHGVSTTVFGGARHAEFLLRPTWIQSVVDKAR
jgi:pimeloyl-ACP methyl ester carboxylesterase